MKETKDGDREKRLDLMKQLNDADYNANLIVCTLPDGTKKAFKENLTLKEAAIKLGIIKAKEFDRIVQPKKMI